jgi:hypothetical protein
VPRSILYHLTVRGDHGHSCKKSGLVGTPRTLSCFCHISMASSSQPLPSLSSSAVNGKTAVVAQGDWTKNLVQLAKNAELKCVSSASFVTLRLRLAAAVGAQMSC